MSLDEQIAQWRGYLQRRRSGDDLGLDALERRVRDQVAELATAGLPPEEAFLLALRRLGSLDPNSLDFAREHHDRLWNPVVAPDAAGLAKARAASDARVAIGFAVGGARGRRLPADLRLPLKPYRTLHNAR